MFVSYNGIIADWIRPVHLDDDLGNPDPDVAETARSEGIEVDHVLDEEVGTSGSGSSSHNGDDNEDGGNYGGSSTPGGTPKIEGTTMVPHQRGVHVDIRLMTVECRSMHRG